MAERTNGKEKILVRTVDSDVVVIIIWAFMQFIQYNKAILCNCGNARLAYLDCRLCHLYS